MSGEAGQAGSSGQEWHGVAGRRVVITGATQGIGLAAAQGLAELGAQLTIVARDPERASQAVEQIRAAGGEACQVDIALAELSSLASVTGLAGELAERYPRIDVLINNAGALFTTRRLSAEGIEATWVLNHLAPFLLTNLLLDGFKEHPPARIITTSSDAHRKEHIPFDDLDAQRSYRGHGFARYGETKLANILFTSELARRLEGSGVTANCYHPGLVGTGFNRNNGKLASVAMVVIKPFSRTPAKGAETLVWLADSPAVSGVSGGYFVDRQQVLPAPQAQDSAAARRLWDVSARQVGLGGVQPTNGRGTR